MKTAAAFTLVACTMLLGCLDPKESSTEPDSVSANGIPVVEGIQAKLDTAAGVVTLTWNRSSYPKLLEYLIYRVQESDDAPEIAPAIGRARDTVFVDSVRKAFWMDDFHVKYFVRIKNPAEELGASPEPLRVHIIPSGMVRTAASLLREGTRDGVTSIRDTVKFIVQYDNPTRKVKSIQWDAEGYPDFSRSTSPDRKKGSDTLVVAPDSSLIVPVRVRLTDEAGATVTRVESLTVLWDAPVAHAKGKSPTREPSKEVLGTDDSLTLSAEASDGMGRIVKWEWNLGKGGRFVEVSNGDTTFLPDSVGVYTRDFILRVTDDDGLIASDTLAVRFASARRLQAKTDANFLKSGSFQFHPAGDRLLAFCNGLGPRVYHISEDRWSDGPPLQNSTLDYAIQTVGERLFAVGPKVQEYDFDRDAWIERASDFARKPAMVATLDDRIYACGQSSVAFAADTCWSYDTRNNALTPISAIPPATRPDVVGNGVTAIYTALIPFQGKLYALREEQNSSRSYLRNSSMAVYDAPSDSWTIEPGLTFLNPVTLRVLPGEGTMRVITPNDKKLYKYDPVLKVWSQERDLLGIMNGTSGIFPGYGFSSVMMPSGDSLFVNQYHHFYNGQASVFQTRLVVYDLKSGEATVPFGSDAEQGGVRNAWFPDPIMAIHRNRLYIHHFREPAFVGFDLRSSH